MDDVSGLKQKFSGMQAGFAAMQASLAQVSLHLGQVDAQVGAVQVAFDRMLYHLEQYAESIGEIDERERENREEIDSLKSRVDRLEASRSSGD